MARVEGLTEDLHDLLTGDCPECATQLLDFFYALVACKSIKEPALDSFGYTKAQCDFSRRYWSWELGCDGTVSLHWKRAVARNVAFDCQVKGARE